MPRRSFDDEYNYDDEDFDDSRIYTRRYKKEEKVLEKKKRWERESAFNDDHDYYERR